MAAVNSPAATVVSGEPQALAEFEAELSARHVLRWPVPASDFVAHSARVEELAGSLAAELATVRPGAGQVRLFSTVTVGWADGAGLDAGYWYDNVRQTVRFADSVRALAGQGYRVFVEVSAHPVLTAAVTETAEDAGAGAGLVVSGTLDREDAGAARLVAALAGVHVRGITVDWAAVLGGGQQVDLPTYAFQRQRYWPQAPQVPAATGGGGSATVAEGWRYRISWVPVAEPAPAVLSGAWLVVAPAGLAGGDLVQGCVRALAGCGAEAVVTEVGVAELDRELLAARIGQVLAGLGAGVSGVSGVVSLLALDEAPLPGYPGVPAGLAGTQVLVQALGAAGVGAPLWVLTCGAVATGAGEVLASPGQAMAWGLGRVAGLEHPDRWGGLIDVPAVLDERAAGRLCGVLAGCGEDQAAIRGAGIMARRLVRAPEPRGGGAVGAGRNGADHRGDGRDRGACGAVAGGAGGAAGGGGQPVRPGRGGRGGAGRGAG